jgi:uncharacterized protein (TIGR03663 family)
MSIVPGALPSLVASPESQINSHSVSELHEHGIRVFLTRYGWAIGSAAILLVAFVLRLYKLELKPLHNDEGVNAYFFLRLFRVGLYRYDPANYHGPTLYYFALIFSSINALFFGEGNISVFVLRSVPALVGVATISLILSVRKYLGGAATLVGAALAAVSPAAVYFSRDFIHEAIFVFFTLTLVIAALKVWEKATWTSSLIFSIQAALLFATKETAGISIGVLCLALATSSFWCSRRSLTSRHTSINFLKQFLEHLGGWVRATQLLVACAAMFVVLSIIFYSSFLANSGGWHDALTSLKLWANIGTTAHRHGILTYFLWLGKEECTLLVLGAAGTTIAVLRRKQFPLFAGLWAFGLLAAYSLIPYKTPWLTLNFIIPLALASGYATSEIYNFLHYRSRLATRAWVILLTVAFAVSLFKTCQLNFYRYDDDRNPYVYAQTRRELLGLVDKVNAIAKQNGTGLQTSIAVISPDYWPLPWYLRNYLNTGYYGHVTQNRADIVIASAPQAVVLNFLLRVDYDRVGDYPLRPGVNLVAFARRAEKTR